MCWEELLCAALCGGQVQQLPPEHLTGWYPSLLSAHPGGELQLLPPQLYLLVAGSLHEQEDHSEGEEGEPFYLGYSWAGEIPCPGTNILQRLSW